ncbi:LysR family transcriptional regulator [Plastorhodobacter daqingensis]|uniref:LysR family transcriptional regulator n=1 Tax=Plastorhodobacter daqingensis TaxID=1387281 RepID=A0ABW2UG88_9RHOB
MESIDESRTDFHALRLLATVHRLGSFSAAAEALGLNQSTVSYGINRLRKVFGDPLFVRVGQGIRPTQRCDDIARGAASLVRQFEELTVPATFEPSESREKVVISCNFYEREIILPRLFRILRKEAPHMRLSIIQANARGHEQLLDEQCDLLLTPVVSDTAGLYVRTLFEERYAGFVSHDSSLAGRQMTMTDYAQAAHVAVRYQEHWRPFYHAVLAEQGITVEPALELPSFGNVSRYIEGTDLLLTAPSGLHAVLPGCARISVPFDSRFKEQMFWNARSHERPINRWLRTKIVEVIRQLEAEGRILPRP